MALKAILFDAYGMSSSTSIQSVTRQGTMLGVCRCHIGVVAAKATRVHLDADARRPIPAI